MKNTYKLIKYVIKNWPTVLNEAAYSEGQFNQLFTKFKAEADAKAILETEYKAKQKAREDAIKKLAEVAGLTEEEINAIL